jgi:AbrB family looped-hinge helix DNA binding protein
MKSRVSEKGQVTIPKRLRNRLGIRSGEVLEFREEGGQLIAEKAPVRNPVDAVYGVLELGSTTDEFMAGLRGPDSPR